MLIRCRNKFDIDMVTAGILGVEYAYTLPSIMADYLTIIGYFFRRGEGRWSPVEPPPQQQATGY